MSHTNWQALIDRGKELGFESTELRKFVVEQQANEREERMFEREEKRRLEEKEERKRETAEAETLRIKLAAEVKAQREFEFAELKREADEKEALRLKLLSEAKIQHDLELVEGQDKHDRDLAEAQERLEQKREFERRVADEQHQRNLELKRLEFEVSKADREAKFEHNKNLSRAKPPKLVAFNEASDNIDAYIDRFERFAIGQNWPKEEWSNDLSALLTGKALNIFHRLSCVDSTNYDILKETLLLSYDMTSEGFRKKFRDRRIEKDELPLQFISRLKHYLMRWIDLTKTAKTFDDLVNLIIREQFINSCDKGLAEYLNRHLDMKFDDLAQLANKYVLANSNRDFGRSGQVRCHKCSKIGHIQKDCNAKVIPKQKPNDPGKCQKCGKNHKTSDCKNHIVCDKCHNRGHFTIDCRIGQSPRQNLNKNPSSTTLNKDNVRRCFLCNSPRHLAKDCGKVKAFSEVVSVLITQNQDKTAKATGEADGTGGACVLLENQHEPIRVMTENKTNDSTPVEPVLISDTENDTNTPDITGACYRRNGNNYLPVFPGYVGIHLVETMRDTGCTGVVVKKDLVESSQFVDKVQTCMMIDGTILKVPMAKIHVDTPYFIGEIEAMCMINPVYDLIIGNVPGAQEPGEPIVNWKPQEKVLSVLTRAQTKKAAKVDKPLKTAQGESVESISVEKLIEMQTEDQTLNKVRDRNIKRKTRKNNIWFEKTNGVLYRCVQSLKEEKNKWLRQVVVPEKLRSQVMLVAHDSILAGHMGVQKTLNRILLSFYWPGIEGDVKRYCRSCNICQRTIAKGKVPKIHLGNMPLIDQAFKRIAIDLVGPIFPVSDRGFRYILTIVDYATRYPEAIPLKTITTEVVAEALVSVFSRVGIPREILSDLGTQFTSAVMIEVSRLLSIKQLHSSPYHPICNGLVEKMNGTLKQMLKRLSAEKPKDWDRYLIPLLFAYREVPQDSTGFSPFELLYGRSVRGPMQILKEYWTNEQIDDEVKSSYEYVLDLKNRIEETCQLAREELAKSQVRYKKYYDRTARSRSFKINDEVLILLPTDHNKLILQWKGPYKVIERTSVYDYVLDVNGKRRLFHANMLKRFIRRGEEHESILEKVAVGILEECDGDDNNMLDIMCLNPSTSQSNVKEIDVNPELDMDQLANIDQMINTFSDLFSDNPGRTGVIKHEINTTTKEPVRAKVYNVPFNVLTELRMHIDDMLKLKVIEKSKSSYAAPVVLVRKKDGTNRFCVDFRKLNQVTLFDPEPMMKVSDLYVGLKDMKYFTNLDLSKGYWQVEMREIDKEKTAFIVPGKGCFQFTRMPFGLVNSAATFNRLMRQVLGNIDGVSTYIDDVLIHTKTWLEHIELLKKVFGKLREAGLTVKASKCKMAYQELEFVGHRIGINQISPDERNLDKIRKAPIPKTKKQVQSFVGLANYYRNHLSNFATLMAPITDLISKNQPNLVKWTDKHNNSFEQIKELLCSTPILQMPDIDKSFIVQVDASDVGIGAVLLQENNNELFPVSFASRKLLSRERSYAVVEKECLAVIYALHKFHEYLYGKEFIMQTDHMPLVCLNHRRVANDRIMRWSLQLQPYNMRIEYIKGTKNVIADYLSRSV